MDTLQSAKFDSIRSRVVLSRAAAREIFIVKSNLGLESANHASTRLAVQYCISSKAIRDIWKGRSWLDATFDLWSEEARPPRRVVGRPKGKKDSKPRVKGQARGGQDSHRNDRQYAVCSSRSAAIETFGQFDECRYTQQSDGNDESRLQVEFHASTVSDSCHPPIPFSFGEQIPWSMSSRENACLLPSFGSFMQGMGLVPAMRDPFANLLSSRSALAISAVPFDFRAGLSFA